MLTDRAELPARRLGTGSGVKTARQTSYARRVRGAAIVCAPECIRVRKDRRLSNVGKTASVRTVLGQGTIAARLHSIIYRNRGTAG